MATTTNTAAYRNIEMILGLTAERLEKGYWAIDYKGLHIGNIEITELGFMPSSEFGKINAVPNASFASAANFILQVYK